MPDDAFFETLSSRRPSDDDTAEDRDADRLDELLDNPGVFSRPLDEDDLGNPPRVNVNLGNVDVLERADEEDLDEEEEDRDYPEEYTSQGAPGEAPIIPLAPVRMTLDLDEQETSENEGLGTWETYSDLQGDFHILITEMGTAFLHEYPRPRYEELRLVQGIVRYRDKTTVMVKANDSQTAKALAEKYLAKRPYKTAYDRILEGPSFDEPDPLAPEPVKLAPTAAPRPKAEKRVWKTVPIDSGDKD